MANSGYKKVLTLRKYIDGVATDQVKNNEASSVDYVSPLYDPYFCGGTTTTTTTSTTTTTTTTTTNSRLRNADLIGISVSSGPGDTCSVDPQESRTGVLYVKLSDFTLDYGGGINNIKGIVKSSGARNSLTSGKYVLDNQNKVTILGLQSSTLGGIPIYGASEGYFHEDSLYKTSETISPFITTNEGAYTVSKMSLLDSGLGTGTLPLYHIQVYIRYDHSEQRNYATFRFCKNQDYNDNTGGGLGDSIGIEPQL